MCQSLKQCYRKINTTGVPEEIECACYTQEIQQADTICLEVLVYLNYLYPWAPLAFQGPNEGKKKKGKRT